MTELKPCQFCGGRATIRGVTPVYDHHVRTYGYGGYFVMCED